MGLTRNKNTETNVVWYIVNNCVGEMNAKTVKEIAKNCSTNATYVRYAISNARCNGIPIITKTQGVLGVYVTDCDDDIAKYADLLERKAKTLLDCATGLKGCIKR